MITDILAIRPADGGKDRLAQMDQVIIYGAGVTGRRVLSLLERHGIRPQCFLDQQGDGRRSISGIPVIKPEAAADSSVTVIIALFNHTTDIIQVTNYLRSIGYQRIMQYTELFLLYSEEMPTHYWLGPIGIYNKHTEELSEALSCMTDEYSKDLFCKILRYRMTGGTVHMPEYDPAGIYFPSDLYEGKRPDRFIDCGAFSGDTLMAVKARFGKIESVRAFEPDPENFGRLVRLNQEEMFAHDAVFFPCGVWSSTCQLRFDISSDASSSVSHDGNCIVQAVSLDDCIGGYNPSVVKMDIEGSEIEALKGAAGMITDCGPDLAISLYHRPEHLWEIPLLIKKMVPEYRFFIRSHGPSGYDTVLYAHV